MPYCELRKYYFRVLIRPTINSTYKRRPKLRYQNADCRSIDIRLLKNELNCLFINIYFLLKMDNLNAARESGLNTGLEVNQRALNESWGC